MLLVVCRTFELTDEGNATSSDDDKGGARANSRNITITIAEIISDIIRCLITMIIFLFS